MRILITGFTIRQCGESDSVKRPYATVFDMLETAAREAGHDVVRRRVTPGEDLRGGFDLAVIGVHAMASMASSRRYGGVWTATQLPHCVWFQDWKVRTTADHMHTQNYLWKSSHLSDSMYRDFELAAPHSKWMDRVRARWSRNLRHVVLPMFEWADPLEFKRRILPSVGEVHKWDVSPWLPQYGRPSPPEEKERRWVCASLSNQTGWLEEVAPSWPVDRVFNAEKWSGGAKEWGFVPEEQLVGERYGRSWGVMMPFYGAECIPGWWRSRPVFAAQSGCVLWADHSEVSGVGQYHAAATIAEVERMPTERLAATAHHQASIIARWVKPRAESAAELDRVLRSATMEAVPPPG